MRIYNRKFRRDYQEIEKYEAGIALTGAEVKSIRVGRIRLEEAMVKIMVSGAFLINAEIPIYQYAQPQGYDLRRSRKLLLHHRELIRLKTKLNSGRGLTIVPISCYNKGHLIKLEIALAKGRREIEKKKLEKKRDIKREEEKEMKEYIKN
jgi:SsrA-binding protein